MKNIFRIVFSYLLTILFNRFTIWIIGRIKYVMPFVYGVYMQKRIKSVGQGMYVEYPFILVGGKYISIGKNFSSRSRLRLEAWDQSKGILFKPEIKIGDNVIINFDCHIGAINKVIIGNNVLIASRVFITDHYHGSISREALSMPPINRLLFSKGPVIIEDNVWIGEGVVILPNVRIGMNSIIGANAVVSHDIPDNSVVGGIPAKVLKHI